MFSSTVSPFRAPEMQRKAPKKHGAKHNCRDTQRNKKKSATAAELINETIEIK